LHSLNDPTLPDHPYTPTAIPLYQWRVPLGPALVHHDGTGAGPILPFDHLTNIHLVPA
jgi:hypothetical protein